MFRANQELDIFICLCYLMVLSTSAVLNYLVLPFKIILFDAHVNFLLRQCSQRLYLLKLVRCQGMSNDQLDQVTHALVTSRLRYALLVWCGFLTIDLTNRNEGLLERLKRSAYLKDNSLFLSYVLMSGGNCF